MSAQPFDSLAGDYDEQFTHTRVGQLQRQRVYHHLEVLLKKERLKQVIEFNCGTGEDACWLAQQGSEVLATDSSEKMIQVAEQKASDLLKANESKPRFQVLALEDSSQILAAKPVDLIFSNFGGLNCLGPEALQHWAHDIAPLLRPGAYLAAVVMGRFCAWESLYFLLKGQWANAGRRRRPGPVDAILADDLTIPIWYYSPRTFAAHFAEFETIQVQPIGFALPPSYLDPFFQNHPRWLSWLNQMEKRWGHWPAWAGLADHFWILLQKP